MKITHASHLNNDELVVEVTRLARGEREADPEPHDRADARAPSDPGEP
jgi:hypothetical protein